MRFRPVAAALSWLSRPAVRYWLSGAALLALSLAGLKVYAGYVDPIYAIDDWLAWPLLAICGYAGFANLAWLSAGNWLVCRVLGGRDLPILERVVLGAACGVVGFVEVWYVVGALGGYVPSVALLVMVALFALGARDLLALAREAERELRMAPPTSRFSLLLWAVGGALLLVIYLGILSPDALNYDSTWCHLTVAQDYAREGRIVPFPGDYNKTVPQLASMVHSWGFMVPGLTKPVLRWMLALHQEFALFVWTLAGVAATMRRMLGGERLSGSWVAFFLFPIIFVYDNGLGGAADHIAAFFALPGLLAAMRLLERPTWQSAVLMALPMAGGVLTKYQSVYWILPLLGLVGLKVLWRTVVMFRSGGERSERRALGWLWAALLVALPLLASPHFIKNWVYYRDPVYPLAQHLFRGARPTVDDAVFLINTQWTDMNWVPSGSALEKAWHALKLTLTFSFEPHYSFTKNFPAFGSLFTLLLPALLVIRRRGPKLLGAFVGMTTLFLWGYTYNVDRNLQIFLPILAATTGAILVEVWRLGWLSRLAIAPLLAFQLLWGADAIFYSSQERLRLAFDLIGSGYAGNAKQRFDRFRSAFIQLGEALPRDAVVMLHTSHVNLGIDRRLVLDWAGFQGLIGYSRVHTARELLEMYRGLGLTHVLWVPGERPAPSLQEDIVFHALAPSFQAPVSTAGGFRLQPLPKNAPAAEAPYTVVTFGATGYGSGVFPIQLLKTNEYIPVAQRKYAAAPRPVPEDEVELSRLGANAVVVGARAPLTPAQSAWLKRSFAQSVQYSGQHTIYLRK